MKHIRFSPWLILALAAVLFLAVGCDRPDPQVAIDTPQPMNVPQQPVEAQAVETPVPGGEANAPDGAATPTLPPIVVATLEGSGAEITPIPSDQQNILPTAVPPTSEPQVQPTQAAPPAAQVTAQGNVIHTVKSGETLFSIGRQYNVNPYSIAAANNIAYPYLIYPGQQLTIPTGTTPPGPTPVPPPSGQCRYRHTVRPGDNLYRISLAYGVPMATIASANGIANYNLIYAGQTLCVP